MFLVDRIDASLPQGRFEHINCVCFLRPTSENLLLLLQLIHQQSPPRRNGKGAGRGPASGGPGGVASLEIGGGGKASSIRGGGRGDLLRDPTKKEPQKQPTAQFKELHIFFSAPITREPQLLRRLAKQDEAEKIVQVRKKKRRSEGMPLFFFSLICSPRVNVAVYRGGREALRRNRIEGEKD